MENKNCNKELMNRSGKVWAGLLIIIVGMLLLLDNVGLALPHWLFHWSNILIVLGLFIGFKHQFKNSGWLIMVFIGSFFTLKQAFGEDINFGKVVFPAMLVLLGLFVIFKPKNNFKKRAKWMNFEEAGTVTDNPVQEQDAPKQKKAYSNDYVDSVNVFGGSHQTIYSKNFKGGDVVAVFGGCELNLTQSDFEGQIVIDITAIFGGCKIIIPAAWEVKQDVTAIFGGIEDKRSIQPLGEGKNKLLIIKGIAMFGGVDIRNY